MNKIENKINIANILTFSRIVLGAVFLIIFLIILKKDPQGMNLLILETVSLIVFITAIITDGLDGYFARKNDKVTEFGKHFDPLSDSIFFVAVFFSFMMRGMMPFYFFVIIAMREAFMHLFLRPYYKRKGKYLSANIYGKIKTVFQSVLSTVILSALIFKQVFYLFVLSPEFISKHGSAVDRYIGLMAYSFSAFMALISVISLTIYIAGFKKDFIGK